ncbi:11341_t:CDS:2 [Acaulospora morrowiae]|uniref:11341_t:CDS:1 n=1 Tax=Acaulospora morrowiae TaxID=94023 RepID=A0A9N9A0T2_9GLOM|nr:11341_t:CDS:2 [Acaulospora morrowiae]
MNNYLFKDIIGFLFNKKKHYSTLLNFFFWKVILFQLVPFAAASIVDESYSSHQDVYDALLNTLFPITLVILFNISKNNNGESEKKENSGENGESEEKEDSGKNGEPETRVLREKLLAKENLLPLLDDLLYNTVTWAIPLTVSFAYNDLLSIKIFSVINASLHITCAISALIRPMSIVKARNIFYFNNEEVPENFLASSTAFTQWALFRMKDECKKEIYDKKKKNKSNGDI